MQLRSVLLGLGIFGGLFLWGTLFLYLGVIAPQRAVDAAQDWVETPCEILDSSVVAEQRDDESSKPSYVYAIDIRFKYNVDGQEHVGDRFDFSELKDGYKEWKRQTVAALPPGTKTVCFVNPDDPSKAVIRRGFGPITDDLGNWFFSWVVPAGMMLIGLLGVGFFLICGLTGPLGRAFDRALQVLDPDYQPYRGESDATHRRKAESADEGSAPIAAISSDRVRELLRRHGETRSQGVSDWKGDIPLPPAIATFYREVGPVDVIIEGYGHPTSIPSLAHLWDRQAAFRGASNESLWNRISAKMFRRWNRDWIVVAIDGTAPVVYSVRDGKILEAQHERHGPWETHEVYPTLNVMAASMAILGSVAADAGEDLTDRDSRVRTKYLAQAISRLTEELGDKSAAEAALSAAGWGEAPQSGHG